MMCGRLEGGVDMMYVSVAEGNVGMRCLSGNGFWLGKAKCCFLLGLDDGLLLGLAEGLWPGMVNGSLLGLYEGFG
jgi:hypothetical protein